MRDNMVDKKCVDRFLYFCSILEKTIYKSSSLTYAEIYGGVYFCTTERYHRLKTYSKLCERLYAKNKRR